MVFWREAKDGTHQNQQTGVSTGTNARYIQRRFVEEMGGSVVTMGGPGVTITVHGVQKKRLNIKVANLTVKEWKTRLGPLGLN